jgi:DNA invertase Pin-like site-specific DNA recombinase
MTKRTPRAAVYARVSTLDQTTENQLAELRRYIDARGWTAQEYIDEGVSGAKESRPALDSLLRDARRRRFDVVVCWRLDRLGRNLKHLITLLEDLQALGIAFVSLNEGIDATTPAGRLQMHILGAIAEFERARIAERVRLGLARVRAQGKQLGRPKVDVSPESLASVSGLSIRKAAKQLGVSPATIYRRTRGVDMQAGPAGSRWAPRRGS